MRRATAALLVILPSVAVVATGCGRSGILLLGDNVAPDAASGSGVDSGGPTDGPLPESLGEGAPELLPHCMPGGPGMTDCGPNHESCCTSLEVTGGTFYRTYWDTDGEPVPTQPGDPATISSFRLDKYEVTVGRFRRFAAALDQGWLPPVGSGKHSYLNGGNGLVDLGVGSHAPFETGWVASYDGDLAPTDANLDCPSLSPTVPVAATWTSDVGSHEDLPVTCVTWAEAYAFCIWDGGFLPSWTEAVYASTGGSQQRPYPWGSTDPGEANQFAVFGCYYPAGPLGRGICTGVSNIAPVGSISGGAGAWGQLDLAGNVDEWNLDFGGGLPGPCTDCATLTDRYPPDQSVRTWHGGDFSLSADYLISDGQSGASPSTRSQEIGFRCARSP